MPIIYDKNGAIKRPNTVVQFDQNMISSFAQCARSVKYFAEKFYYIVNPVTGAQLIELRDYQIRILEGFQNNRFNILLSARQIGKTTCSAIYLLWFALFNKDKTIAILANKADTAKSILAEIKFAYEHLPIYLKQGAIEYNQFNIKFENGCIILAKATSPDALRGESVSLLFLDEFAFVPQNFAEDFWTSNYPTLSTGGAAIIVSTPNGTANLFYKLWKDSLDGKNSFNHIQVNWHEVPGRDEKWKEETIRDLGKIKFAQEFGCQFVGSSITLIDADFIVKHLRWKEPELKPDEHTKMWSQPKPGHKYLIAIDTGGGVGSDNSVMNIFDITYYPQHPVEQVAMWRRNDMTPPKFSEMLFDSAQYWNNAYVIGEINGLSNEVLTRLMDMEYENIYYDYEDETYGLYADKASKPRAVMWFKEELEGGRMLINDSDTIDELGYFEEVKPGVYKARVGRNFHDDTVMTCIWATHFLKSTYFIDEREEWFKNKDVAEENVENNGLTEEQEETLNAFLQQDEQMHGENWLDNDERGNYRPR